MRVINGVLLLPCSLRITVSEESQLLCHEDFQATFWRGSRGEKLRPLANSQYQLAGHVSE